jgi:hypothetical protein
VNRHPFLRAYMAGVLIPTWMLLVVLAVYQSLRGGPLDRMIAFPMALVPNLWGLWNLLYLRLEIKRRISLGLWGALLPFLLSPSGVYLVRRLEVGEIEYSSLLVLLPVALGFYYLVWKHLVGFLNRTLEI